ncbi:hypothetical protein KPC83_02910 [Collinsella sp. zg1085]|uniref:hypothetical protein n=1 Tax=Collinsella sp. zg1085 TaxID=2844380 RepID=UPI001C0CA7B7|nr:hypothetical protein [Collinsella sp. zg1085]QWT18095.1 hypothetical protein KPC83_02910 [Collinsella sp. zg1085]
MAILWQQLPATSRVAKLQDPSLEWETGSYLLWRIEFHLQRLFYLLGNTKQHPLPQPKPLLSPAQRLEAERRRSNALKARAEIDQILGMAQDG